MVDRLRVKDKRSSQELLLQLLVCPRYHASFFTSVCMDTVRELSERPELTELEQQLLPLGEKVRAVFEPLGLHVTGFHYYQPRRFQMEREGLCLCFDAETHNQMLYGPTYENGIRTDLQGKVFGTILGDLQKILPGQHICLDIYPKLVPPFEGGGGKYIVSPDLWKHRLVDVFKGDEDIFLDPVDDLRAQRRIEEGSDFDVLTKKYGLTHVLRHGPFIYISPDTFSPESVEALLDQRSIRSILEIGCGVGTCGIAAARRGITDYTCVELSPKACVHLTNVLPNFTVMQQDAFDFAFDRHYDLFLMGIPYEFQPWFLERKGKEMATHCAMAVFNSGMTCMYDQEHDWILGRGDRRAWPWWKKEQELGSYFPNVAETSYDWQLGAVASHQNIDTTLALMEPRGFSKPAYTYIPLE